MKLRKTFIRKGPVSESSVAGPAPRSGIRPDFAGFSIIELLVVIAIVSTLLGMGLLVGMDSYRRSELRNERGVLVDLLERARSRAMNNYFEMPHGVHVETTPEPGAYVLFRGTYNAGAPENEITPMHSGITVTEPAAPFEIVFTQLSGIPAPAENTITLTDNVHPEITIKINAEGQIDW